MRYTYGEVAINNMAWANYTAINKWLDELIKEKKITEGPRLVTRGDVARLNSTLLDIVKEHSFSEAEIL